MTREPFENEIARRLGALADQAPTSPTRPIGATGGATAVLATRRTKRWSVAAAAAVVTVTIGGGLALASRGDSPPAEIVTTPGPQESGPSVTIPDRTSGPESGAAAQWPQVGTDWWELPQGPSDGRVSPVKVWTGRELIVWGGETESETTWADDGAAFNPATGQWRILADSPLSPRSGHAAVWTGAEVLVCCGRAPTGNGRAAAAYDPATDSWRSLAAPPIDTAYAGAVWTGTEMLVVGGAKAGVAGDDRAAVAYDPGADSWRMLAEPPETIERQADVVWAGGRLVVSSRRYAPATFLSYDPVDDAWGVLPRPPESLAINGSSMVFTGTDVIIWGVSPVDDSDAVGARLTLGDDRWTRIADDPLPGFDGFDGNIGSTSAVWTGAEMIVFTGALGNQGLNNDGPTAVLAYDPGSDGWRSLPIAPTGGYHPEMLWTGEVVLLLGYPTAAVNPVQGGAGVVGPLAEVARCPAEPSFVTADPSLYKADPVYVGNEMPTESVKAWAETQPGFEALWIDRAHNGWITLGFSEGAGERQAQLADVFPGVGVVVVALDWTQQELLDLRDAVADAQAAAGLARGGGSVNVHTGLVDVFVGELTEENLAPLRPFAGPRLCASGVESTDVIRDGPQPQSGDGWRLLATERTGTPYRTGIATNQAQYAALWARSGITDAPPEVDFANDVVIYFGAVYGSSCEIRMDDVVVDHDAHLVYGQFVVPGVHQGCTNDARPEAYVVAVDRGRLPSAPFVVQLSPRDPPAGAPEERTTVQVDLRGDGAEATDAQIS